MPIFVLFYDPNRHHSLRNDCSWLSIKVSFLKFRPHFVDHFDKFPPLLFFSLSIFLHYIFLILSSHISFDVTANVLEKFNLWTDDIVRMFCLENIQTNSFIAMKILFWIVLDANFQERCDFLSTKMNCRWQRAREREWEEIRKSLKWFQLLNYYFQI